MPISIAQFKKWQKEAGDLWNKRADRQVTRPHPAMEVHGKVQFMGGYVAGRIAAQKELTGSK